MSQCLGVVAMSDTRLGMYSCEVSASVPYFLFPLFHSPPLLTLDAFLHLPTSVVGQRCQVGAVRRP
jgi:hypothetical protein